MGLLSALGRGVGNHFRRHGREYAAIGGLGAAAAGAGMAATQEQAQLGQMISAMPPGPMKDEALRVLETDGPYAARRYLEALAP